MQLAQPLQNAAAMVRTVLLLSVASLLFAGSAARADEGGPPGLTLERTASRPLPRWEVHLGAGAGAARVAMLGSDHGALAVSIDTEAIRWSNRHTGLGLYVGEIIADPWTTVKMDDHPVSRELPFIVEPEIVHRSITQHSRWLATGWTASVAAGVVITRTRGDLESPVLAARAREDARARRRGRQHGAAQRVRARRPGRGRGRSARVGRHRR